MPKENHLRSGPSFHITFWSGTLSMPRHPTKHQHRLSPTNRWRQRAHEPVTRTVPQALLQHEAEQLAHLVATCTVHEEFMAIRHHEEITFRPTYRIHPDSPPA